ncbi:MAG: imidazole glycerol phosphate synthase subunit HisH [Candidatus Omnitrophica bacterium]|nr:imidazole glycerol phosphate synthase subunit HisH [Candidatus Omnitrophota bacterium]MDD5237629.1 imidazole glycerol phosphate synthase subunit HisH [Candidatus Omnitrophota bacterium]
MIAIIDYGMGNIHSVNKALELYGVKTIITNKAQDIKASDKAVLPGVGAFDDAMLELDKQNLTPLLKEYKKPLLGICLGMQLFFEESKEGNSKGLGLLNGKVEKFAGKDGFKVPHMGWNQLKIASRDTPLLKGIPDNSYVYFCHSFYPKPKDKITTAATTDYGVNFASLVWQDNIFGVQFHPEKSQKVGLKILENFVKLC